MPLPVGYKPVLDRMGSAFEFGFKMLKPALKAAWGMGKLGVGAAAKTGWRAAPEVIRYGAWHGSRGMNVMLNNPRLVMGLGLVAGATAMINEAWGSGPVGRSTKEGMNMAAQQQQMPSTGFRAGMGATRQSFLDSTEGLVQGLHRGRHR